MKIDIEQQIRQQLPIESNSDEVRQFLETNYIEYSWIENEKLFSGIIRNIKSNFFIQENLKIKIYMNEHNQVILIKFETIYTGL